MNVSIFQPSSAERNIYTAPLEPKNFTTRFLII